MSSYRIFILFACLTLVAGCGSGGEKKEVATSTKEPVVTFGAPHPRIEQIISDKRFSWQSTRTEHFDIYTQPGSHSASRLDFLEAAAEGALENALDIIDEKALSGGIRLFMVDSREEMEMLMGRPVKGFALFEYDAAIFVFNDEIRPYFRHEVFHLVSIPEWGLPEQWLMEGSAVFADGECLEYSIEEIVLYLYRSGQLIALSELIDDFDGTSDMIAYIESAGIFEFLYENYEIDQIRDLWISGGSENFQTALDVTRDEFEKIWLEYLDGLDGLEIGVEREDWELLLELGCG